MKHPPPPVMCSRLETKLRQMNEIGDKVLSQEDIKDLVLLGYVSLKFRGNWYVNNHGLKYLAENPEPIKDVTFT